MGGCPWLSGIWPWAVGWGQGHWLKRDPPMKGVLECGLQSGWQYLLYVGDGEGC